MKKLSFLLVGLLLGLATIAQPVVDNAIIPVSVNLNSILRLNVTSGGNIEFTVNNIDQYTSGIVNSPRYDTKFTVASSVDFNVLMYAEGDLLGADNTAHTLPVDNVGYILENTGSGAPSGTNYTFINDAGTGDVSTITPLNATATTAIITGVDGASAGNTAKNAFTIHWELATTGGAAPLTGVNTTGISLLAQSIAPDRYTTNVFLVLEPRP